MSPHTDQGDRPRARVVRRACRRTRAIAARIGRARRHHSSLCPAPHRPRLSESQPGRGDPARPTTRRTHCNASYRTRSAARLDRSASSPGELKNDPRQSGSRQRPGLFSLRALISPGNPDQCLSEKSSQGEPARGQHVPFSSHVQAHTPGESRVFAPVGMEGTRETDSPLEGDGFELSVPHERGHRFELSFFVYVPETVRVLAQRTTSLGAGGSKSRVPPGRWGELPIWKTPSPRPNGLMARPCTVC